VKMVYTYITDTSFVSTFSKTIPVVWENQAISFSLFSQTTA